jgi:hypothetical protein
MIYVLKMDNPRSPTDSGCPTRVRLIGPFKHEYDGAWWASYREPPLTNPNNPHDNPCWQIIDLDEPTVAVVAP